MLVKSVGVVAGLALPAVVFTTAIAGMIDPAMPAATVARVRAVSEAVPWIGVAIIAIVGVFGLINIASMWCWARRAPTEEELRAARRRDDDEDDQPWQWS